MLVLNKMLTFDVRHIKQGSLPKGDWTTTGTDFVTLMKWRTCLVTAEWLQYRDHKDWNFMTSELPGGKFSLQQLPNRKLRQSKGLNIYWNWHLSSEKILLSNTLKFNNRSSVKGSIEAKVSSWDANPHVTDACLSFSVTTTTKQTCILCVFQTFSS